MASAQAYPNPFNGMIPDLSTCASTYLLHSPLISIVVIIVRKPHILFNKRDMLLQATTSKGLMSLRFRGICQVEWTRRLPLQSLLDRTDHSNAPCEQNPVHDVATLLFAGDHLDVCRLDDLRPPAFILVLVAIYDVFRDGAESRSSWAMSSLSCLEHSSSLLL